MKVTKIFTPTYSVDKHNLRYLLSNIPTRPNCTDFVTTNLKTEKGSIMDLRAIGGETIIIMGKSKLEVSHLNGEVLKYKKPFFKSLKKIVNQATELISYAAYNIKNPDKVNKITTTISSITKDNTKM